MVKTYATPKIRTTVELSPLFYKLCKEHKIKFSEAMRVGISVVLAELGIEPYDNKLNIVRKMQMFQQKAEEALQQIEELKQKHEKNI